MKTQPYYTGLVTTAWLRDGRDMLVLADVWYTDAMGVKWFVPKDSTINGASTGWFLRRLFPAYVGKHRDATVFHDVYCENKLRPSREVHRMFYEAMRFSGVNIIKAWVMWLGVRLFGPRF